MPRVGTLPCCCPPFAQGTIRAACKQKGREKTQTNDMHKEKALPRKELKKNPLKPKPVEDGEHPKPAREKEGEERGGSRSKPSLHTQPALRAVPVPKTSFLKAMGPGAGPAGGEEPASRGWEAKRGALGPQGEHLRCAGGQAAGWGAQGLSQLLGGFVFRKHTPLQAAELPVLPRRQESGSALFCPQSCAGELAVLSGRCWGHLRTPWAGLGGGRAAGTAGIWWGHLCQGMWVRIHLGHGDFWVRFL